MSFIIKALTISKEEATTISIITSEGIHSYKHTGIVEDICEDDIKFKSTKGMMAIKIENIIKVEE